MPIESESGKTLDAIDWLILATLQQDARLSYAELGRRVKLSPPSVAERVRRLEEAEIILGYSARVNPKAIGLDLRVLIDLTTTPDRYPHVISFMQMCDAIRSAHHVTGQSSFRIEVWIASMPRLEALIGQLSQFGQTSTTIVLSSPVEKTFLPKPE